MSSPVCFESAEADFLAEDNQPITSWADQVEEELGDPVPVDWETVSWGLSVVDEDIPSPIVETRELFLYF